MGPGQPDRKEEPAAAPRYRARIGRGDGDLRAAQALRWQAFRARQGGTSGRDADAFDAVCGHVLIEEAATGALAGCFRFLVLHSGAEIARSYSAQHYDLTRLAAYPAPMVELGRFCLRPGLTDPDVLRMAWAALARIVAAEKATLVFGCSSFLGTEAAVYADAFALLTLRHIGPRRWLPKVKAPRVVRFARDLGQQAPDMARALAAMPPLLRSYLRMGGWVSDHAVVDGDLGTLHVFTGVEVGAIPEARTRRLRSLPVALG